MYRILNIGGKDYKLQYTIEASLYSNCVEKLIDFYAKYFDAENSMDVHKLTRSLSDVPNTALTIFYAGLMEEHGVSGDQSVTTIGDAKRLLTKYFEEHKDDDTGNFYGILKICMDQMGEDGFFKLIGLEAMIKEGTSQKETQRKKASTKNSEK